MNIAIAIDGSHQALHALSEVIRLASEFSLRPKLHAVCVVDYVEAPNGLTKPPQSAPDILAEEAETALAAAGELCDQRGFDLTSHILRGHVVTEILRFARDRHARLIVVGTHGRKGVQRAILGSTCEGLIRSSEIPVVAVKFP
jgi:nucleotide-binding universal stress UspA family protein